LTGADVFWLAAQSGQDADGGVPDLHLEGAYLRDAHLERAYLREVHLAGADLSRAHMVRALLDFAHLEGAFFIGAHLEYANILGAHLEGPDLTGAHLEGPYLQRASFDKTSRLNGAVLTDVHLDQTIFDNADLSVVNWRIIPRLGEERTARQPRGMGEN
jgi:uncharacterized protein YjbI with pentapeptide repeats